jgi:hypothetical protein
VSGEEPSIATLAHLAWEAHLMGWPLYVTPTEMTALQTDQSSAFDDVLRSLGLREPEPSEEREMKVVVRRDALAVRSMGLQPIIVP